MSNWLDRRRERIVAEVQRNRRGDYRVPTWVFAALPAAIVVGWITAIVLR